MKKNILFIVSGLAILLMGSLFALWLWIDHDVKQNIKIAKANYPGNAEDALISYLLDQKNPMQKRTSLAIWTLGQIHSRKALPIIKGFYKNDPKGKTCYGQHSFVLCQREMHNAIKAIEKDYLLSHEQLNK
jgi:hypothetical protein